MDALKVYKINIFQRKFLNKKFKYKTSSSCSKWAV